MKPGEKLIVDTNDDTGARVIFTDKKRRAKSIQHPELNNNTFLKNVVKTIEAPHEVWEDYDDKRRKVCYYKKYSTATYVKVVIWIKSIPCEVVTAFEINKIKEVSYPNLKRLR